MLYPEMAKAMDVTKKIREDVVRARSYAFQFCIARIQWNFASLLERLQR